MRRPTTGIAAGVVVCALRHHDEEANVDLAQAAGRHAGAGVVGFDVAGDELLYPDLGAVRAAVPVRRCGGARADRPRRRGRAGEQRPRRATRRSACAASATEPASEAMRRCSHGASTTGCASRSARPRTSSPARPARSPTHPIHTFLAAGCNVVLGDDNPITIDTTLSREVEHLREGGVSAADLGADRGDGDRVRVLRAERQGLAARRRASPRNERSRRPWPHAVQCTADREGRYCSRACSTSAQACVRPERVRAST